MTNDQPMTLRELAAKIQKTIAKAKAVEEARNGYTRVPAFETESMSDTRAKIRKANDF